MAGYDLGGSFPAAKYLQFTQSRNHSFHLILLFFPTLMRGSDIVAKVAFISGRVSQSVSSISQIWLTIDSSFLRSGGHKDKGTRAFVILYLVPGWCECRGNNGAGEAGEGFQRADGGRVSGFNGVSLGWLWGAW